MSASDAIPQPLGEWPPDGLERVEHCPICGSSERNLVHRDLVDRTFFCAPGAWNLYRCGACRSCYLDPRPTQGSIELAYRRYLTHVEADGAARAEPGNVLGQLARALTNGYCNWRHGTRFEPASKWGIAVALLMPLSKRGVMRHLPRLRGGGKLLDVGAGNGGYLLKVREAGWEVHGIEPDPLARAAARAKGLDVRPGGIDGAMDEAGTFDFITINHVIEHVHDPREVLARAATLLKARGSLYIETPNVESHGHRRFGRHWRGLEPPRHLVLFNWKSLERLLLQTGFERVRRVPRPRIYPSLAAKSRAIRAGRDPEAADATFLRDRLTGAMLDAIAIADSRRSEFITVVATKP